MKKGKTVQELATEILRQQEAKRDFLVPGRSIRATEDPDKKLLFGFKYGSPATEFGNTRAEFFGDLTETAHQQVADLFKIPGKYYDLLRVNPELLVKNVNYWLDKHPEQRLIRTLDGKIRAILSSKYRRLDNFDLVQHVLPLLEAAGATIESSDITETKLYIKAVTHHVSGETKVGDVVSAGILIQNSEVGHGSLGVKPMVYRKVCANGMIIDKYAMKKYHVGKEQEQIDYKEDTLEADDIAFWMKVRDLVDYSLSQVTFDKVLEEIKGSTKIPVIDPVESVELVTRTYRLRDTEHNDVLKYLTQGGDLTSYGLGNAVTQMAQVVGSYDRSTELESIGFEVMGRDWNR